MNENSKPSHWVCDDHQNTVEYVDSVSHQKCRWWLLTFQKVNCDSRLQTQKILQINLINKPTSKYDTFLFYENCLFVATAGNCLDTGECDCPNITWVRTHKFVVLFHLAKTKLDIVLTSIENKNFQISVKFGHQSTTSELVEFITHWKLANPAAWLWDIPRNK